MSDKILPTAALVLGSVVFVGMLFGMLDLAANQQASGFPSNANALRRDVGIEIAVLLLGAAITMWRSKSWIRRFSIIAAIMWVLTVGSLVLLAQATVIP